MILQILSLGLSLVSLVCWVMTLIKMFQDQADGGIVKGILGIICPLWAYIWGWMTSGKHNTKNLMLAWTACIVISMILNAVAMGSMMPQ